MPSYPPVQSVVRAFRILRELNQRSIVTIDHLHKTTRLPKPTIVRLLETLIGEGLVTTDKRLGGYCVTSSVKGLSTGYHNASLLVEAGRAHCATFTKTHKWPLSIAVPEDNNLVIRFNTIADSPLSPQFANLNHTLDPRLTGHGRAYLAYCSEKERAALLRGSASNKSSKPDAGTRGLRQIIARVKQQGYGERDPAKLPAGSSTIALPVRVGDHVLGTVGLTYFTSAVTAGDVEQRLVPPLRNCVAGIEKSAGELIAQREH
jgi:IclR family mhp operon transcriptional activator